MAFLDHVAHREAEMAEPAGDRDDQAHMRLGQLVQGLLVAAIAPRHGELVFLVAFQVGRVHRRTDETARGV